MNSTSDTLPRQPEFSFVEIDGQQDNALSRIREKAFGSRDDVRAYFRSRGHELRNEKDGTAVVPMHIDWCAPQCAKPASVPYRMRHFVCRELTNRGVAIASIAKTSRDGEVYESLQAPFCEIYRGEPIHRRAMGAWFTESSAWVWLDFDDSPAHVLTALKRELLARGLDAFIYSTHGHGKDPSIAKFRLCVFTKQRYPADQVPTVRRAVARMLASMVKSSGELTPDAKTFDYTRLFYLPAVAAERYATRVLWFSADEGASNVLDLDTLVTDEDRRVARVGQVRREQKLRLGIIAAEGEELEPATEAQRAAATAELAELVALIRTHPKSGIQVKLRPGVSQPVQRVAAYAAAGALALDDLRTELRLALSHYCDTHGADQARRIDLANLVSRSIERGWESAELPLSPEQAETIEAAVDAADETGIARVHSQLRAQVPEMEITLDEARAETERRTVSFSLTREKALVCTQPGVGKSRQALWATARTQEQTNIIAQGHALLAQHGEVLRDLGVAGGEIAHRRSPLSQVGDRPLCVRRAELDEPVRKYKINLRKSICPRCPECASCAAFAERSDTSARILLASLAAATDVLDGSERRDAVTVLDEQPALFEQLSIPEHRLRELAGTPHGTLFYGLVTVEQDEAIRELARAFLDGRDPRNVTLNKPSKRRGKSRKDTADDLLADAQLPAAVDPLDIARASRGQLHASRSQAQHFSAEHWARWPWFAEAVYALFRLALAENRPALRDGVVSAILRTPAYDAVLSGRALLLSATPITAAFPGFDIYRPTVRDGCTGITRELHYRCRSTSTALRPEKTPRWGVIARDLDHMRRRTATAARVLLVTFKWLADALTRTEEGRKLIAGWNVEIAWYGATAGLNHFQEGGSRECDVFVTYGDFRPGVEWMLTHLAHERRIAVDERETWVREQWRELVADELSQAHGRARDVSRTKPCTHLHYGRVAPRWWHKGNATVVVPGTGRPRQERSDTSPLERALEIWGTSLVAKRLGVSQPAVSKWRRTAQVPENRLAEVKNWLTMDLTLEELFARDKVAA